jgi:hypothetical protein
MNEHKLSLNLLAKASTVIQEQEEGGIANSVIDVETKFSDFEESADKVRHLHAFIAAGVSCYALALLDELGLIDKILEKGDLNEQDVAQFPNRLILRSAFITLHKNGIFREEQGRYFLTKFGSELMNCRGSIGLIYNGYRHVLANQTKYAVDEFLPIKKHIDSKSVAKASIYFGEKTLDPIVVELLKTLKIQGTICDLGCGAGTRLIDLCTELNCKGLGLEMSRQAIKLAKQKSSSKLVSIKQEDITKIKNVWPDVELIMQFFVMHDITPDNRCLNIIKSYDINFPNLKYFLYVDVVAPCSSIQTQLPGFDYVHSLLGIQTRTYEETLKIFRDSQYEVINEVYISGLSNTFLWLLQKKNSL